MIRQIPAEELSLTIGCAQLFFEESQLPGELNLPHWKQTWTNLISQGIGSIFVFELEGKVYGILGGLFFPCSMTGDLEALEGFWYVQPEHRNGIGAIKLLKAFEEEGKKRGCKRVKMVHLCNLNPEKAASLYTRMGYSILQVHYSKEL